MGRVGRRAAQPAGSARPRTREQHMRDDDASLDPGARTISPRPLPGPCPLLPPPLAPSQEKTHPVHAPPPASPWPPLHHPPWTLRPSLALPPLGPCCVRHHHCNYHSGLYFCLCCTTTTATTAQACPFTCAAPARRWAWPRGRWRPGTSTRPPPTPAMSPAHRSRWDGAPRCQSHTCTAAHAEGWQPSTATVCMHPLAMGMMAICHHMTHDAIAATLSTQKCPS